MIAHPTVDAGHLFTRGPVQEGMHSKAPERGQKLAENFREGAGIERPTESGAVIRIFGSLCP